MSCISLQSRRTALTWNKCNRLLWNAERTECGGGGEIARWSEDGEAYSAIGIDDSDQHRLVLYVSAWRRNDEVDAETGGACNSEVVVEHWLRRHVLRILYHHRKRPYTAAAIIQASAQRTCQKKNNIQSYGQDRDTSGYRTISTAFRCFKYAFYSEFYAVLRRACYTFRDFLNAFTVISYAFSICIDLLTHSLTPPPKWPILCRVGR